jgi:tRNA(His) guanylyltransferase
MSFEEVEEVSEKHTKKPINFTNFTNFSGHEKKFENFLDKTKVTIFRLDGHSFSKFTSKFTKPFDDNFTDAMINTAEVTFNRYGFSLGFVGSDEITLCWFPKKSEKGGYCDLAYGGRTQKLTTLLAGSVSTCFFKEFSKFYDLSKYIPHFDCRVFQVDTIEEALENISQRVGFTLKNSRMMFAQSMYSQKQLHKLSSFQAVKMVLDEKGIDFNTKVRVENRIGTVLKKITYDCELTVEIKGVKTVVKTKRTKAERLNLYSKEVLGITFDSPKEAEPDVE